MNAWTPYDRPLDLPLAAHLYRRAGFAATQDQLRQAMKDGPQATLNRILQPPPALEAFERRMAGLSGSAMVSESAASTESAELWIHRMQHTPYPLLEKMTLFWHDYFAIAGAQVGRSLLMERHIQLLRKHALGRFDALLRDLVRDPATLIALNSRVNHKSKPSHELATALLRYTSQQGDPTLIARAFTGYAVLRDEFQFRDYEHDSGAKQSADDTLQQLLQNPATARNVVRRMYRWLVSETAPPGDELLEPLAASFARDFDIAKLAASILRSNHFFSEQAYQQRVKSPVEFAIGLVTANDRPVAAAKLHQQMSAIGQRLLEPPAGTGWAGGLRWLNSFTIAGRANLAASILPAGSPELANAISPEFQLS